MSKPPPSTPRQKEYGKAKHAWEEDNHKQAIHRAHSHVNKSAYQTQEHIDKRRKTLLHEDILPFPPPPPTINGPGLLLIAVIGFTLLIVIGTIATLVTNA